MLEIVSLLGPSGAGKSTLTGCLVQELSAHGLDTAVIGKDAALHSLVTEKSGNDSEDETFTTRNMAGPNRITQSDLHAYMNTQIRNALTADDTVVILEGGTRTRHAQAETLQGIDLSEHPFGIIKLEIPFFGALRRLRQRRIEQHRPDDAYHIMLGKLAGQYLRPLLASDAPRAGDHDVFSVDALLEPDALAATVAAHILTTT